MSAFCAPAGPAPVWQKTYGGGLRGLNARMVSSPSQYPRVLPELGQRPDRLHLLGSSPRDAAPACRKGLTPTRRSPSFCLGLRPRQAKAGSKNRTSIRGASRQACRVGCRADFRKAETILGPAGVAACATRPATFFMDSDGPQAQATDRTSALPARRWWGRRLRLPRMNRPKYVLSDCPDPSRPPAHSWLNRSMTRFLLSPRRGRFSGARTEWRAANHAAGLRSFRLGIRGEFRGGWRRARRGVAWAARPLDRRDESGQILLSGHRPRHQPPDLLARLRQRLRRMGNHR